MPTRAFVLTALRSATYTLVAAVIGMGVAALLKGGTASNLQGRLVAPQERGIIPIVHFDAQRLLAGGYAIPPDTHVFIEIPSSTSIDRKVFFGGPDTDKQLYWGYQFSGHETARKRQGKLGRDIYDGAFFYSSKHIETNNTPKRAGDNDLLGLSKGIHSAAPIQSQVQVMRPGQYYVMTSVPLYVGLDTDGDTVNDYRERLLGSDLFNADTDADGLADGTEVYGVTKTSVLVADSDSDGLLDGFEDKNRNGLVDTGETSPKNPDTDHDNLCDGDGLYPGCPEPRQVQCTPGPIEDPVGGKVCRTVPLTSIYGEDKNLNGIVEGDDGETDPRNALTYGIDDWLWQQQYQNSKKK